MPSEKRKRIFLDALHRLMPPIYSAQLQEEIFEQTCEIALRSESLYRTRYSKSTKSRKLGLNLLNPFCTGFLGRCPQAGMVTRLWRCSKNLCHCGYFFPCPGLLIRRMEFDAYDLAHPVLFHGHTVENVGHGDGAFVVRDDYKL